MTEASAIFRTSGSNDFVSIRIDTSQVEKVLGNAPKIAFFWLREYLFGALQQHRKAWLAEKGNKFGRGSGEIGGPIRVRQINDKGGPPGPVDVAYQVHPRERRAQSPADASRLLGQVGADIFTGNVILPIHQEGRDIASPRFMSIAVKTRPTTPARWRAKYPGKTLRALPSKRDGKVLLYEVQQVKKRGRTKKGETPATTERLRLRFLLTKFVDMKPTLKLYESWDGLSADRDAHWRTMADRMLRDFERGDARDFA